MGPVTHLLHGTSSHHLDAIMSSGLRDPCLTSDPELALYYAESACEEFGGDPLVLRVSARGSLLRADSAAFEEPVHVGAASRICAIEADRRDVSKDEVVWLRAEEECLASRVESWADLPASVSLAITACCRLTGRVDPSDIEGPEEP